MKGVRKRAVKKKYLMVLSFKPFSYLDFGHWAQSPPKKNSIHRVHNNLFYMRNFMI